jgi:hypothetical protein
MGDTLSNVGMTISVTIVAVFCVFVVVQMIVAAWYLVPISPMLRRIITAAVDNVKQQTGRPVRRWGPFVGGSYVGRKDDQYFVQIGFADTRKFGTPIGPPRQYFAVDVDSGNVHPVTPADVRPYRIRWTIC